MGLYGKITYFSKDRQDNKFFSSSCEKKSKQHELSYTKGSKP